MSGPIETRRSLGWHALNVFSFVLMLGGIALVVAPVFMTMDTYGVHDWDQMEAHRYLAVKTLKTFHQFPFWNPYSCGGHTWWGGLESGTNLVSPFLPVYLLFPLTMALRLEIVGCALLGAIGTWMLASRFTQSPPLRFLAAVAFAVDGRFSLQASVGHTWHLYYAWTPWALFFLDRAIDMAPSHKPGKPLRNVVLMGATLAMMVYTGAIYPLPQTIVVIALYAIMCAVIARSWRPIGLAVAGGLLSFAFAAPRLLPILDMLRRYPRFVDSMETIDVTGFVGVFTSKEAVHPPVGPWGWHEFGIYIGWIPFLMMLFALVAAARARERALRFAGAICLILGLGRFNEHAPWAYVHDLVPIFASQHVPSRWFYPAVLVLVIAAAGIFERVLARQSRRTLLELALVFVAAYAALDMGLEAQKPLVGAFARKLLPIEDAPSFHQEKVAGPRLHYDIGDWAPPALPAMMANVGVIDCSTFPGLDTNYRDHNGHLPGLGAIGKGDVGYRGEIFFADGPGTAMIETWTPNAVVVHYSGARPGDPLVMNQNWDPGWSASEGGVIPWADMVATRVDAESGDVTFRYRPRFFLFGVFLGLGAIAGLVWLARRRRVSTA
jgi:hypothetical protein